MSLDNPGSVFYSASFQIPSVDRRQPHESVTEGPEALEFLDYLKAQTGRDLMVSSAVIGLSMSGCIDSNQRHFNRHAQDCEECYFTGWTPGFEPDRDSWTDVVRTTGTQRGAALENAFDPAHLGAVSEWMDRNHIEPKESAAATVALLIQTALVLDGFNPGPRDGAIGAKTMAAIVAWRTAQGLADSEDLPTIVTHILRTVMQAQGFATEPGAPMLTGDM